MRNFSILDSLIFEPTNYKVDSMAEEENYLRSENISLMPLTNTEIDLLVSNDTTEKNQNNLVVGDIYTLSKKPIEGMTISSPLFKLCAVIRDYKGININSVVVSEVALDDNGNIIKNTNINGRRKFSIPPHMCKKLNIEYEDGLELWPINSGFTKVNLNKKRNTNIDYSDLSTYPLSEIDGTIRKIIICLHGFSPFNSSHIITPNGNAVNARDFITSLTVKAKDFISTNGEFAGFKKGESIPFKIILKTNKKHQPICDDNSNIYIELNLAKHSTNALTEDGMIGISPLSLRGKDANDIFTVCWYEYSNRLDDEIAKKLDEFFDRNRIVRRNLLNYSLK